MIGTELVVWESYKDLTGRTVPIEFISAELAKFSRTSVLWCCSYISLALQLGLRGEAAPAENYRALLNLFFGPSDASRLYIRQFLIGPRRFVFHRRQVLLLAKLAVLHCGNGGANAASSPKRFGPLLLMINDHFHFDTIPSGPIDQYSRHDLLGIATDLLVSKEFSHGQVHFASVRSHAMCKLIAPTLTNHPDYTDIDAILVKEIGVDYALLEALTFACATRFSVKLAATLISNPAALPMYASHIPNVVVSAQSLLRYLSYVSSTEKNFTEKAQDIASVSNDFTIFRKTPFARIWMDLGTIHMREAYLLLDQGLLFDKIASAPYWAGVSTAGNAFSRFWGAIFEEYAGRFMASSCKGTGATYIHKPAHLSNENEELCDGMVLAGDSVVLIEYKSTMFTAKAKYSGDPHELGRDIRKKLVFDDNSRNPKAVHQLAAAVKRLFGSHSHPDTRWFDAKSIKRCYVLVVTLDSVGGGIGISTLLNIDFQELLVGEVFSCEIRPLYCLDVEVLEVASGSFHISSLANILERWFVQNPLLSTPLSAFRFDDLVNVGPEWLRNGWDSLTLRAMERLFPSKVYEADERYQRIVESARGEYM